MPEGNKRREWVKNAMIIFLAVMLILTFFSNTIMNWSLPEVSAQNVDSGALSEHIRGTATVEAAESYTVKLNETRVVASVEVKQGDTVEKGQVLIKLEAGDSAEAEKAQSDLDAARDALDSAEAEYKKMLLSSGKDYTLDELKISNLENDIAEKKADLKNVSANQEAYEKAKEARKEAEDKAEKLKKQVEEYDAQLVLANSEKESDLMSLGESYYKQIQNAQTNVDKYEKLKKEADDKVEKIKSEIAGDIENTDIKKQKTAIEKANSTLSNLQSQYAQAISEKDYEKAEEYYQQITDTQYQIQDLQTEYEALVHKASENSSKKTELTYAEISQKNVTNDYNNYKKKLDNIKAEIVSGITGKKKKAEEALTAANNALEDAKTAEDEAKTKASVTVEQAEEEIKDMERELQTAKITLSQTQKQDMESAGSSAIDVEVKQKSIEKQKEKIALLEEELEKLKKEAAGGEITAQVAGVIDTINCIAGETIESGANVAVIQMTEKGYTASINVTSDQAKKVRAGDKAEIEYFWYGNAEATLTSIKADKANPRNKQLVFSVTGDVTPGQSLQLVLGGKGQRYECLVPNSAVREDNNGKFVLTVVAKSSPLGNRYTAKRVDVQVLASDDKTSAVSGELMQGDFIISTSTKPINPGDQVRLVDN